jgi:hypothetical protein
LENKIINFKNILEKTFSWTFYFMFLFSALLLVQLLRFWQFFCKYWVSWAQKADFEPSFKIASHFVKIIAGQATAYVPICPNCPNQLNVNRQYPIRAHCSIVTVATNKLCDLHRKSSKKSPGLGVLLHHSMATLPETTANPHSSEVLNFSDDSKG